MTVNIDVNCVPVFLVKAVKATYDGLGYRGENLGAHDTSQFTRGFRSGRILETVTWKVTNFMQQVFFNIFDISTSLKETHAIQLLYHAN